MDLSVVIPFAGEYPLALTTVASVYEELRDRGIEFEVIAVDNDCPEWRAQLQKNASPEGGALVNQVSGDGRSRSREALEAAAKSHSWLKVVEYTERLSHWQAKNVGVRASSGKYLWFCDAHVIVPRDNLWEMLSWFHFENHGRGSVHFADTYKLLEAKPNQYKLKNELDKGFIGYALSGWHPKPDPYEVPAASSCGMLTTRALWDRLGGWPQKHSYSGGEHFWNFVLATLGEPKYLWTRGFLRHHGAPRDYHWTLDGYIWNQCAAMYMIGGQALALKYIDHRKGRPEALAGILSDVLSECFEQRQAIKKQQTISIEEWVKQWQNG
jgi:glycosyltransferase involved in cell wall biosynthesis